MRTCWDGEGAVGTSSLLITGQDSDLCATDGPYFGLEAAIGVYGRRDFMVTVQIDYL